MIRTEDGWRRFCSERGTSGDQVFDILKDWSEESARLTQEISGLMLRPLNLDDLEQIYKWRNDPEIMARTRQWRMLEWNEHLRWFNNLDHDRDIMRAITVKALSLESNMVGVCGLTHIDWVNRSAEVSIYIGDENFRRKGVAKEAIRQLKVMAFDQMNLHRLWAEIYSFNSPGLGLFKSCGFGYEDILLDTVYRNGKYYNSHFYNFLEDAWKNEKSDTG